MQKFKELKFNIGELKGISAKNTEEHLKLYAGYVKHANLIREKINDLSSNVIDNSYTIGELQRRFGFEFNGMRNHEYYFKSLEEGPKPISPQSELNTEIETLKQIAMTRGVGWAVLGFDKHTKQFVHIWIDEQHLGQLNGVEWILGIDMWEHAYVYDYPTSEKKKYIEAFFENLNWETIEKNLEEAKK